MIWSGTLGTVSTCPRLYRSMLRPRQEGGSTKTPKANQTTAKSKTKRGEEKLQGERKKRRDRKRKKGRKEAGECLARVLLRRESL